MSLLSLRKIILGTLSLSTASLLPLAANPASSPWSVGFDPRYGLSLRYDGIPIIRQSTLYIVSPDWTPVLYNQEQLPQQVERFAGRGGPGLTIRGENEVFSARYRMEALDETRFHILFEGSLKKDVPAHIEFAAAYFNGNLISGVPFRGESNAGEARGRVQDLPVSIDQHANEVLPFFRWLEFDSRIGKLRVEADAGGERVMFFDARRDPQGWARRAPIFWCGLGVPTRPLSYGQPVRFEMTISLQPKEAGIPEGIASVASEIQPVPSAQSPRERPVLIVPTPKTAHLGNGEGFLLTDQARWTIRAPGDDPRLADALLSLLGEYRLEPKGERHRTPEGSVEIFLGNDHSQPGPEVPPGEWRSQPEGYRLVSNVEGIRIYAPTSQGAFYGLQTLAQLLRPMDDGVLAHAAVVEDWPSMQFRGAHWFPSASGVPFHEKLIERIMARYKMNHVVIQCEAALWESHPAIAAANSIRKPDLQRLVDLARANFIQPIPLVNVPGHGEWMFRNGQNRHFVEDPDTPYAYCVNHPDSFAFIQDIMNEAIAIFRPDFFHLGHDEVTMTGRFPHPDCPRCQGETATTLVLKHMERLNAWLGERDIGMMIWGDMMLDKSEIPDTAAFAPDLEQAQLRRANMPDGVIVTDWHYYEGETYPSLDYFHDAGHATIASTWHVPQNIHHFSQAALKAGSLGLLQTTWAGYFPDEKVLEDALYQFTAFILAAEYSWSGRSEPPSLLPFESGTEFTRAFYSTGDDQLDGSLVDITQAARTPRQNWLGLGDGWDFSAAPRGVARLGDVIFQIPEKIVVLGGRLAPETAWKKVEFEIGRKAGTIALLNAAAFGTPEGTVAARVLVTYSDGTTARSDLIMGRNTAHWGQDMPTLAAPVAWQQLTPLGTPLTLRVSRWRNPHPEKILARIAFEPVDQEQAWALAGLTLID
jgi:hexosaminidase